MVKKKHFCSHCLRSVGPNSLSSSQHNWKHLGPIVMWYHYHDIILLQKMDPRSFAVTFYFWFLVDCQFWWIPFHVLYINHVDIVVNQLWNSSFWMRKREKSTILYWAPENDFLSSLSLNLIQWAGNIVLYQFIQCTGTHLNCNRLDRNEHGHCPVWFLKCQSKRSFLCAFQIKSMNKSMEFVPFKLPMGRCIQWAHWNWI